VIGEKTAIPDNQPHCHFVIRHMKAPVIFQATDRSENVFSAVPVLPPNETALETIPARQTGATRLMRSCPGETRTSTLPQAQSAMRPTTRVHVSSKVRCLADAIVLLGR